MSGWEGLLAGMGGASNKFNQSDFGQGLLKFANSPEILDLAAGLLSQAAPSMTEPRSFAGGLAAGLNNIRQGRSERAKNQPDLSNFAKLLRERNAIAASDPNSASLPLYDQLLKRTAEGTPGMELSVGANGEITFSQGGGSRKNTGPQVVKNEQGEDVLVTPQTPGAQDRQQRRATAKAELDALSDVRQPYVGEGSIKALNNDIKAYKTAVDPQQKEILRNKLVNAVVAKMVVPELAMLNTLAASKDSITETDIKHQREILTLGWPESSHFEFNNLPSDLYPAINAKYKEIQSKLAETANQVYAKGAPVHTKKSEKKTDYSAWTPEQLAKRKRELMNEQE